MYICIEGCKCYFKSDRNKRNIFYRINCLKLLRNVNVINFKIFMY